MLCLSTELQAKPADDGNQQPPSSSNACSNRTAEELHDELMTHFSRQQFHPSYAIMPPMTSIIQRQLDESLNPHPQHLYGDMECPAAVSHLRHGTNVDERSLCPWYYVINHDPDRFPYDLVEAECRCRRSCVGMPPELGTGCEKVYYNVPVLRNTHRCDDDGKYIYTEGWHRIAAGCVCAVTRHAWCVSTYDEGRRPAFACKTGV